MAVNPLSAFLYGLLGASKVAEAGVSTYVSRKEKLADIAREEEKNKSLSQEDLDKLNRGEIPSNLGRQQQIQLGEKKMALQASENKGMITLTDSDIKNYPDFEKQGHIAGNKVPLTHYNQVTKPSTGGTKPNQEEDMKVVTDYAAKNNLSLDALRPGGMGGWNPANTHIAAMMIKNHPDKNPQTLKIEFASQMAGATSAAKAPNSAQMFKIRAMSNSLLPQLDLLGQASDAVSRGDIKSINNLRSKVGVEFSQANWSNLKKRALLVADEFQAQIGAGSDAKLDLAVKLIDSADSPKVMRNAIEALKQAVKARAIASTGAIPTEEQITGKSDIYSTPEAQLIKKHYSEGLITKDQANKMIDGLKKNGSQ